MPLGTVPCQQSPNDYSLHYIYDDGSPVHEGEHPVEHDANILSRVPVTVVG
jgi:hypothetical protein